MKININSVSGNTVDFDIIGKGNVLLDSDIGYFDCSPFDDEMFDEDDLHDYILDNIDEIIDIVSKPTVETIRKDLEFIKTLSEIEIIESLITEEDYNDLKQWCEIGLELLIAEEDYDNCIHIKKILNYLDY